MTVTSGLGSPTRTERPTSVEEAAELLRDSSGPLLFRGAGTKAHWGGRPQQPGLVVETAALARLLDHEPADMTVAVEAGMPLTVLQEALDEAGQWLAIDPPSEPAGATVGGLLVTGDFGPRRLRYGAMRDLVIGVTLVLADGTVAHAGGHVIKNVAGYDLSKLVCGSLGSLALVAEVVLRLHPRPGTSATVVVPATVEQATAAALRLLASPLEPSAVDWTPSGDDGSAGRVAVRLEGSAAGVQAQAKATTDLLCEVAGSAPQELRDADEQALWASVRAAFTSAGPDRTVANAGTLPSLTPEVAGALRDAGQTAGAQTALASHPALGLHTASFAGAPDAVAGAFSAWRASVLALGGTVLLRERPPEVDAVVDVLGPAPSAVALLRSLKSRLDPDGRCAPGRFGSWY